MDAITKNPIALVIGGMSYVMTPSFNGSNAIIGFDITFSNTMGKSSLLIHQATDIPASRFHIPLQNIDMKFNYKITLGEFNSARLGNTNTKSNND